jgi:hypothetical protein
MDHEGTQPVSASAKRASGKLRHKLSDRGHDLYQTPVEATRTLLALERLPDIIWEPACGPGAIVKELRADGRLVIASDLVDYKWDNPDFAFAGLDFLLLHKPPTAARIDCIVTNPPFKLATEFAEHALTLCPRVILLCELRFLASQGRIDLVNRHLARAYVFGRRLPTMHREGWTGNKSSSDKEHAWFVFERDRRGPAQISSVDWKDWAVSASARPEKVNRQAARREYPL